MGSRRTERIIFASKNEDGIPAWQLVMSGEKTVTRRAKPVPVGVTRAVQPGRGKIAVGRIYIMSCETHTAWLQKMCIWHSEMPLHNAALAALDKEARKEGFRTWAGLVQWFVDHGHSQYFTNTYRIEFFLDCSDDKKA